jgi:hypothetical protein
MLWAMGATSVSTMRRTASLSSSWVEVKTGIEVFHLEKPELAKADEGIFVGE